MRKIFAAFLIMITLLLALHPVAALADEIVDGTNLFYISYTKDDVECYGYVLFEYVEPVDGTVTFIVEENTSVTQFSIYTDGFPMDATIVSDSDINVYGADYSVIDTLVSGTSVVLKTQNVVYPSVTYEDIVDSNESEDSAFMDLYNSLEEFITSVIGFFGSLYDCLVVLFPFFTEVQLKFLITFVSLFLSLGIYLLFRRLTV